MFLLHGPTTGLTNFFEKVGKPASTACEGDTGGGFSYGTGALWPAKPLVASIGLAERSAALAGASASATGEAARALVALAAVVAATAPTGGT